MKVVVVAIHEYCLGINIGGIFMEILAGDSSELVGDQSEKLV